MDLDKSIEKNVDAARCAANRVAKAGEKAKQLKDDTMQITAEDDWMRYKVSKCFLKRASEVMKEATTARDDAKKRWEDVHEATGASSGPVKLLLLAESTAKLAHQRAQRNFQTVSQLVAEVRKTARTLVSSFADTGTS